MDTRATSQLRPHAENAHIYGDNADGELIESIRGKGILTPLLITKDNRIISGHRRWEAARRLNLASVPVTVFGSGDELDILEALIDSNRQRQKTNEQIGREYETLKRVYHERESKQGKRNDLQATSSFMNDEVEEISDVHKREGKVTQEKPTTQAAKAIGVSQHHADKAAAVVKAVDDLASSGKKREAEQLRSTLNNKSVRAAYDMAKEAGHIAPTTVKEAPAPIRANAPKEMYSIAEWEALNDTDRWEALQARDSHSKFNFQDDNNIEWALWSWNPVTGCKHNCPYCYARDIADRFYSQKFEPTFLPSRLSAPRNTLMKPEAKTNIGYKNVFTCSMADLFGKWVPRDWISAVLDTVAASPQWNFLFLTKFPIRMAEFDFPDNAWVGTTVDCQARVKNAEQAFRKVNAKVKWLSCEPLLEPLQFSDLSMFQWLVLGGSSKSTQTPEWRPPRAWINALEDQAHQAGCMVYEKTNLLERTREYPTSELVQATLPDALRYLPSMESSA